VINLVPFLIDWEHQLKVVFDALMHTFGITTNLFLILERFQKKSKEFMCNHVRFILVFLWVFSCVSASDSPAEVRPMMKTRLFDWVVIQLWSFSKLGREERSHRKCECFLMCPHKTSNQDGWQICSFCITAIQDKRAECANPSQIHTAS